MLWAFFPLLPLIFGSLALRWALGMWEGFPGQVQHLIFSLINTSSSAGIPCWGFKWSAPCRIYPLVTGAHGASAHQGLGTWGGGKGGSRLCQPRNGAGLGMELPAELTGVLLLQKHKLSSAPARGETEAAQRAVLWAVP